MKKGKFTEHQIVSAIKKQEAGIPVKDIAREMGISEATFYNWKAKYGGMQASDVSKMRDLEKENVELKKMYAEMSIENVFFDQIISEIPETKLSVHFQNIYSAFNT
jgi:putative transposase